MESSRLVREFFTIKKQEEGTWKMASDIVFWPMHACECMCACGHIYMWLYDSLIDESKDPVEDVMFLKKDRKKDNKGKK